MAFDRTIEFGVTDVTCEHCVPHVAEELKTLPDVVNVSVTLAKGGTSKVLVYTNADIPDATLKEVIDEAGGHEVESIVRRQL